MTAVLAASAFGLEASDLEATGSLNLTELPEASQSLQEFTDEALDYVQENGKERALEEFGDEEGQFVEGDLRYVFAYGFDGTCLAHPSRPEMVGENHIDLRDANGLLLIRNLNDLASKGGGFTYYVWPNAQQNNSLELKLSYIAKADDDWWLGTGVWLSHIPAVFSAESRLSLVTLVDEAVIVKNLTFQTYISIQKFLNPTLCKAKARSIIEEIFQNNFPHMLQVLNKRVRDYSLYALPNKFNWI